MPEILDPRVAVTLPSTAQPQIGPDGLEIACARRAFATAQALLSGAPIAAPLDVTLGWHDSSVDPESGSFAVVGVESGLDDLIGEVIVATFATRQVYAYVLRAADVPVDVSITRRLFLAMQRLTVESLQATVAAVQ